MATTADSGHQTSTPGRAFRGTPRPSGSSWSTVHRSFRNARASLLQVRPPPVITVEIAAPGPARLIQVRPPPVLTVKIPALRPTRQGRPALGEGPGTPPQLIHAVQRPRLLRPIPSEVLRHVGQQPQEQDSNQETGQKKSSLDECHVLPLTPSAGHVLAPRSRNHALPTSWFVTNLFAMSRLPQVIWQGEYERLGGCSQSTRNRFRPPAGRGSRSRPLHCLPSAAAPRPRGESHDGVPARTPCGSFAHSPRRATASPVDDWHERFPRQMSAFR